MLTEKDILETLYISGQLCKPCLKEWDKLLTGEAEKFEPCEECQKIYKRLEEWNNIDSLLGLTGVLLEESEALYRKLYNKPHPMCEIARKIFLAYKEEYGNKAE